ncbi:hypothetical protein, partial [Rhodovulum sulfidophilum]|uniref:hypothetical protein n=1 Tax=Rhodovulum sulfidophilum TaxID=35806 RepID=UPI00398C2AE1|nr:hypothetical protein [Rhodovulum sulfidophilum]
ICCTVERLMKQIGIRGAVRGKALKTTIPETSASDGSVAQRYLSRGNSMRKGVVAQSKKSASAAACTKGFLLAEQRNVLPRKPLGGARSLDYATKPCANIKPCFLIAIVS